METRQCKICGIVKFIADFPGKRWKCKKCVSRLANQWYHREKRENPQRIKETRKRTDAKRNKTPERRAYKRNLYWGNRDEILAKRKAKYGSRSTPRDTQKEKCKAAFQYAIKKGIIEKQSCSICGEVAEGHHLNYSKPLEVIWLCRKHHAELRRK